MMIQSRSLSSTSTTSEDPHPNDPSSSSSSVGVGSSHSGKVLSTGALEQRLSVLRERSANLSQTLTAQLANTRGGQNLLHLGPNLSTLPPDLHGLRVGSLEPLREDWQRYVDDVDAEHRRLSSALGRIQQTQLRAVQAREAADLWHDLEASEAGLSGDDSDNGNGNGNGLDDDDGASLERAAHAALQLLVELQAATAVQPTTEKARFLMRLAPRIRRLESDTLQRSVARLETALAHLGAASPSASSSSSSVVSGKGNVTSVDANDSHKGQGRGSSSTSTSTSSSTYMSFLDLELPNDPYDKNLLTIGHCLRGMALLGRGKEAESVFARVAIMPILRSSLSMGRLDGGGPRGHCAGLAKLLDEISSTVVRRYGPVLRLSEDMFRLPTRPLNTNANVTANRRGRPEVDLVTAGVWIPVATALMADPTVRMAIFSPGVADLVQSNYVVLQTFLSNLAQRLLQNDNNNDIDDGDDYPNFFAVPVLGPAIVTACQDRIDRHPLTADYHRKWNLPIYYQLRFGEACTRLDQAIEAVRVHGWYHQPTEGDNHNHHDQQQQQQHQQQQQQQQQQQENTERERTQITDTYGFELPLTVEMYRVALWMWTPTVVLRPLAHRFLRGALQLVGRTVAFCRDALLTGKERVRVGTRNAEAAADNAEFEPDLDDVATVAWELTVLESCLIHDYTETIIAAVATSNRNANANGGTDTDTDTDTTHVSDHVSNSNATDDNDNDELRTLIPEITLEASEEIGPLIDTLWNDVIVNTLVRRCSEPLGAVKGVAATYRMTNRPPPTKASPYVSLVLRPLQEFEDKFGSRTPPQVGNGWRDAVVSTVADRLRRAVEDLLETVAKTEVALKNRRRGGTSASAGAAGGMVGLSFGGGNTLSDGDKVRRQLRLDCTAFCDGVAVTNTDETMGHVQSLPDAVQRLRHLADTVETAHTPMAARGGTVP